MRAPVLCVPLVDLLPLQLPDAVHEVAFVELHVSADAAPLATDVGFAVTFALDKLPACTNTFESNAKSIASATASLM